jgi:hypothetical protein
MITQDDIDRIQEMRARRYSQPRVARELKISVSTVARYWKPGKELRGSGPTPKKYGFGDLFSVGKCPSCGLVYPNPKFLYSWNCPGCKKSVHWPSCQYKPVSSTEKGR